MMQVVQKIAKALRRYGPVTGIQKALANPAAVYQHVFSDPHEMLPKHRFERSPTPSELVRFVDNLGIETTREETLRFWLELYDDTTFREEIAAAFHSTAAGPQKFYHNWREVLYVLTRLVQPEQVVETGVRGGLSSAYILNALENNDSGRLVSIDNGDTSLLPEDLDEPEIGWIVPHRLRNRWELRISDSVAELPSVLEDDTDIFFSDVPNDILREELSIAATQMHPGSIVVSSYPNGSEAEAIWCEFVEESGRRTGTATRWESDQRRSTLCAVTLDERARDF